MFADFRTGQMAYVDVTKFGGAGMIGRAAPMPFQGSIEWQEEDGKVTRP